MHQSRNLPSRFRWSGLLLFLPSALILLFFGTWLEMPWWLIGIFVAIAVLSGVVMGALSGRRTPLTGRYGITSQGPRSEALLSTEASMEQVLEAVTQVAAELPRFTLAEISRSGARLTVPMNIKTWGRRITLRFRPAESGHLVIEALSEPRLRITMVDWGQSAEDLQILLGAIDRQVSGAHRAR